jgi:phospholipid/cholesterol/gamma-HCH transport system permease protein
VAQPLQNGWAVIDRTGALILSALSWVGEVSLFGARALIEAFRPPYEFREIARHVFEIGWRSTPLIVTAGLAIGVVLSMHTRASLERFGAEAMIPAGLALALVRETGPLVTALLVAGRVGAGIGAELGAMKVTEQIDALEAAAVDSFKFLAVTRILACILALPLLTTMADFSGIIGGFFAEHVISGMSWNLYFNRAFSSIEFRDFIPATMKTAVFGMIIGTVGCYLGFTTTQGTEGVGRSSTRSVVLSSILIILANVVLVRLIFFLFPAIA